MSKSDDNTIHAEIAEELSPHNKALYEAGKSLLVESVSVGREFCKFMTTTALSAIPLYLGLLKLVLPKDYVLQSRDEGLFLLPPVAFLVSSVVFILGYFPQRGHLSLDLPSEIERERSKTIVRRQRYAAIAFIAFALGVLYGAWQIVDALGVSR
jgi:uncharacterized membrane protein YhhN